MEKGKYLLVYKHHLSFSTQLKLLYHQRCDVVTSKNVINTITTTIRYPTSQIEAIEQPRIETQQSSATDLIDTTGKCECIQLDQSSTHQ